ncbi:MAG: right-handed parallel beta-helix repeat-containing protein, partial [Planctomycetota bacterium]|nr:right-handed parallel beta-helix repeat-containing protein [Planctomycetota bacterium]
LYNEDNSSPNLIDCDFSENSADQWGGGLGHELNCNPVLKACIFTDNSARAGGGIRGAGGNPVLTNCVFLANGPGGGLELQNSNATLVNCTFSENSAMDGGGISTSGNAGPNITNCTFTDNSADRDGGGVFIGRDQSPILVNCMFGGNKARRGAGIHNKGWGGYGATPTLINCTFGGNHASESGGTMYNSRDSIPMLSNSILWGNRPQEIYPQDSAVEITYSDVQGGWPGEGNINADPLFFDPANGDYHLRSRSGRWDPQSQNWVQDRATSPCIDAGDPSADWSSEPFPHGERINMGAYGGTPEASMSLGSR